LLVILACLLGGATGRSSREDRDDRMDELMGRKKKDRGGPRSVEGGVHHAAQAAFNAQHIAMHQAERTNEDLYTEVNEVGKNLEASEKAIQVALEELGQRDTELAALANESLAVASANAKLEALVRSLEADLATAHLHVAEVRRATKTVAAEHSAAASRSSPAVTEAAVCSQQASALAGSIVRLENDVAAAGQRVAKAEAAKVTLQGKLATTEEELTNTTAALLELTTQKKAGEEKHREELKKRDERYGNLNRERLELVTEKKEKQARVSTLEKSLLNRTAIAQAADAAAKEAVAIAANATGERSRLAGELEEERSRSAGLEEALQAEEARAADLEGALAAERSGSAEAREKEREVLAGVAASLDAERARAAALEEELASSAAAAERAEGELGRMNSLWKLKWTWASS
jgi:chromosome segregation ATPase